MAKIYDKMLARIRDGKGVDTAARQLLGFYLMEGYCNFGDIDCGIWTAEYTAMDIIFGQWGDFGIRLHFGDDLPVSGTLIPITDRFTDLDSRTAALENQIIGIEEGLMAVIGGA